MRYSILFTFLLFSLIVRGATFVVSHGGDAGAGSLRQAVLDANTSPGEDIIIFSGNFQVTLTSATDVLINGPVTITGNGMNATIIDGGSNSRILLLQ